MKFDTVIIGGGLAGLICGIRLLKQGQSCAIISSGQSAIHFSSGSFDLLNTMPNGEAVSKPLDKIAELVTSYPKHPYAKLGAEQFVKLSKEAKGFLEGIGVDTQGDGETNHYRITPMGTLKSTWLSMNDLAVSDDADKLPWKRVAIFNVQGFLDFYPRFIADEFAKLGTESDIHEFTLPDIDLLRRNPSEMRATNIAWQLDKENNINELVKTLKDNSKDCDAIILPAVLGMKNANTLQKLESAVGKPIHILPTLPPSIVGIRTQQHLHDYFVKNGGVYMLGDSVLKADNENGKITKVYSYNHRDIPFVANNFVLASGSYFSQGLIADIDKVIEPIFGLDVDAPSDRKDWYRRNMFERQPYQEIGVKTDQNMNGLKDGKGIGNLYVAGAILGGFNPLKEGSGGGVSILTALGIADKILSK